MSLSRASPIHAVVIAVPARDEADRIAACLEAALVSVDLMPAGLTRSVVVSCDCCTDATVEVVRRFAERFPIVHCVEGSWGSAGGARRAALDFGIGCLADRGFTSWSTVWLATTDADSQVAADWLARQLHYASRGADAVAGTIDLLDDPDRSPEVAEMFRRIYELGRDSHTHVHAANLGVRASAYLAVGGFSELLVAEDHALWNELRRRRFHCVSPLDVRVGTSARLRARAPGGFGDTLGAVLSR